MANIYKDYTPEEALNNELKKLYEKYGVNFDPQDEYNREKWNFEREHRAEIAEIEERLEEEQKDKGEIKKQYINITKPLSVFADYGISNKQLADDWVYILTGNKDVIELDEDFETNEDFLSMLQQNFDNELGEAKDELATPEAKARLQELGYDGLILPLQKNDAEGLALLKAQGGEEYNNIQLGGNEYIVFNSNQAKNTDNITPTDNQDIRYSIGGENAKTSNIQNLKEAKKLKKQGLSNEEIFKQTGWYEGSEGKWRFEIDNSKDNLKFNFKDIEEHYKNNSPYDSIYKKIEDVLDAKDLYEAYPELKDVVLEFDLMNKDNSLAYVEQLSNGELANNVIHITNQGITSIQENPEKLKSYLLHELQHRIQVAEGFANGSDFKEWYDYKTSDIRKRLNEIVEKHINKELKDNNAEHIWDIKDSTVRNYLYELEGLAGKSMNQYFKDPDNFELNYVQKRGLESTLGEKDTQKFYEILDEMKDYRDYKKAMELYKNTAGEIEAREVQDRMNMLPEERQTKLPFIKDENTVFSEEMRSKPKKQSLSSETSTTDSQGRKLTKEQQYPQNVKEIKNIREFLRKAIELETNKEWKNRLQDAQSSDYTRISRQSPLQYKREIIQQYLNYKNDISDEIDSKGRALTNSQKEFFKNVAPELRDEDGDIKSYYHGTNADFNEFDTGKIDIANLGKGFYFTDIKEIADSYAQRRTEERGGKPRIIEAYINSKKPFNMANVTREQAVDYLNYDFYDPDNAITQIIRSREDARTEAENFVKEFEEEQNMGEKRVARAEQRGFIKNNNKYDYSMMIDTSSPTFQKWLRKEGYDSILVPGKDKRSGIEGTAVVVLNPNQIKYVDNKNPTTSNDMRYSQDTTGAWNNFIEKYFKSEGEGTSIQDLKKLPTKPITIQDYEEVLNNAKSISKDERQLIKDDLKNIELSKESLEDFKQFIKDKEKAYRQLEEEQLGRKLNKQEISQLYSTYRNKPTTYKKNAIKQALDTIQGNRYGRTKAEWLQVAELAGVENANLSPQELDKIANESWFDLAPNVKSQLNRQGQGYVEFNINDWRDAFYKGVKENRQYSIDTENTPELPKVEVKTKKERQIEKYNKYKKENIKVNQKAVNNLISFKNNAVRSIEDSINSKQALLDSKKNKNTKVANTLKMQIEALKTRKAEIENLYNTRIDKINDKVSEKIDQETRKEMKKTAKEIIQEELKPLIEDSDSWIDKSKGILYNRETAQRNIEDIVKDKDSADYINEVLFNPIQEHQANATRGANKTFERIENLDLDTKKKYTYIEDENGKHIKLPTKNSTTYKVDEATLAQLYLEKKITEADLKDYEADVNKIRKTAEEFKNILDEYYERMNETVVGYGYAPIGKLENYFPHFTENKPDTVLGKIAGLFGIDTTNNELPTEIAGRTEQFKPGKVWNSNILQRKGNKTDYDALKILDRYVRGAEDIINTTGDIQKLRQFERMLRYKYSEQGIQDRIDSIQESDAFTADEKDEAIHNLLLSRDNQMHHLGHLVTWLEDYTNVLANKKNSADREFEKEFGRNMYKNMSAIEGRIAANTIGGNLSVSLTNFAPIFQAMGTTKISNILVGAMETTRNSLLTIANKNDVDFADRSDFLTNRFGADGIAAETIGQKISGALSTPMEAVDAFTAETIVRAKYRENLQKGMTEEDALKSADKYAARIMADRSKGALPVVFNNKNPLSKLMTMFQVEPNNIVSNYLKDMPRNAKSKAQLTWQTAKLMGASWLFNTMAMAIRGGNEVLPDPIRLVSYLVKYFFGDDEEEKEQAEKDLQESLLSSIPFVQNVAGFLGFEDIGRVPISNAMPDLTKLGLIGDKDVSPEYKKQELTKEFSKPLLYLGLPVGGAQLNKTIQGIATIKEGGSYKINKEGEKQLQFPVNNDPISTIKASVFGKYSLPQAQKYIDSGFKALNAKQTEVYKNSNIDFDDLTSYLKYSSSQELKDDKGYVQYTDDNGNIYWYDGKKDKVYSSEYKEVSKPIDELQKSTKKEKLVEYIDDNMKDLSTDDKWELYKYNIISTKENDKGESQLTRAESLIKNKLTTKEEYMNLLDGFIEEGIDLPDQKTTDKLIDNKINLDTYYNYKLDVKKQKEKNKSELKITLPISEEEQDKKADVTDKQKCKILQNKKYSNSDKKKIYENFVGTDDTTYSNIKLLTGDVSINAYLDYKQQDIKGDDDPNSNVKGKTKSGTKKKNVVDYLVNSGLSDVEQAYIFGKNYSLYDNTNNYYNILTNQLNSVAGRIPQKELKELYLSLYNVVELENGEIAWK